MGDSVENDEIEEQDGRMVRGILCNHGGNTFSVYGGEGGDFAYVEFQYHVKRLY